MSSEVRLHSGVLTRNYSFSWVLKNLFLSFNRGEHKSSLCNTSCRLTELEHALWFMHLRSLKKLKRVSLLMSPRRKDDKKKEWQRRAEEVPKAVMNEYRTFSLVFHKMVQCWSDWPVCFLDKVPTDAEVSSASPSRVTGVLLPLVLYLAVLANVDYICNSDLSPK